MSNINKQPQNFQIFFLDMNSFFASVEQQVQPTLRGLPIGVAPFTGNSGCIIAASREAKAKGIPVSVGMFPLAFHGKAMAAGETDGFMKVVRHRETNQLLGVHMMGHNVTEAIAAAGALLHMKASVTDVAEAIFAHPTMTEGLKEAAEDAMQMALHVPPRKMMRVVAGV
jgi:nucleotidyltransferase/DNA polymerase involved in DNA repair